MDNGAGGPAPSRSPATGPRSPTRNSTPIAMRGPARLRLAPRDHGRCDLHPAGVARSTDPGQWCDQAHAGRQAPAAGPMRWAGVVSDAQPRAIGAVEILAALGACPGRRALPARPHRPPEHGAQPLHALRDPRAEPLRRRDGGPPRARRRRASARRRAARAGALLLARRLARRDEPRRPRRGAGVSRARPPRAARVRRRPRLADVPRRRRRPSPSRSGATSSPRRRPTRPRPAATARGPCRRHRRLPVDASRGAGLAAGGSCAGPAGGAEQAIRRLLGARRDARDHASTRWRRSS